MTVYLEYGNASITDLDVLFWQIGAVTIQDCLEIWSTSFVDKQKFAKIGFECCDSWHMKEATQGCLRDHTQLSQGLLYSTHCGCEGFFREKRRH